MNEAPIAGRVAVVVEDDAATRHLLRHILQKEVYSVRTVDDGRAAERLIAQAPPPALVTLDFQLPHVNGIELLETIQRKRGWEDVPVLMLSTNAQQRHVARALDAGAAAYMVKLFRLADLRATVQRLTAASDPITSRPTQFAYPFSPAYGRNSVAVPLAA